MPEPDSARDATRTQPAPPLPAANEPTGSVLPPSPGLSDVVVPGGSLTRVGRFELRQLLGEGTYGQVYRGFDPDLRRDVAIKVLKARWAQAEALRERFLREARATAAIHHPNVCPVYEAGFDGDLPYIVMRFIPGGTLADLLARRGELFPPRHAAAIARKLALGMAAAHATGVIHRDLKPQNVLWDEANREVLITDFGLARIGSEAQLTDEGDMLGTPAYMSPEQARGNQSSVGPLSDVYSLGVILYRLLTGEPPFQGTKLEVFAQVQFADPRPPAAARPGLDAPLSDICLKAMAKNPADRPTSARALAETLEAYLRGSAADGSNERPPLPAPAGHPPAPLPPGQPQPFAAGAIGTEVLVCPSCKARLQVQTGRTLPVVCPRCATEFTVAAGRVTFGTARPADEQALRLVVRSLTPLRTEPAPPKESPAEKPKPRAGQAWKSRRLVLSLVSLVLVSGIVAGIILLKRPDDAADKQGSSHRSDDAAVKLGSLGRQAVVAIESGGVRLIAVDLDKTGDSYDFDVLHLDSEDLGGGLLAEGGKEFRFKKVDEAMQAVVRYVELCKKNGVPAENIAVACNSGAVRTFDTPAAKDRAKTILDGAVKKACGLTLQHVSAADEARYGAIGCFPAADRLAAIHVDIDEGNIKLGFYLAERRFKALELPTGTKALAEDLAAARKANLSADAARRERVNAPLASLAKDWPALVNREKYHLVGGASWAVATLTHPVEVVDRVRVPLTADDIANYNARAGAAGQTAPAFRQAVLDDLPAGPSQEAAAREVGRVFDRFDLDYLVSAGKILQAFAEECQFSAKKVQFFTHGLHAWPLGYILVRTKQEL